MIYIMSDIHGRADLFHEVLEQINLREEDHLYILGDVIDRNPDGIQILNEIRKASNMTLLLGNHEHMMLQALDNEKDELLWSLWFSNGGIVTYDAYAELDELDQGLILDFMDQLPISVEVTANGQIYLLAHGRPEVLCQTTRKHPDIRALAVWSEIEADRPMPEGKVVVFGHTPTWFYTDEEPASIWHGDRKIGVDCGCAYAGIGRLGCLRLDDMKEFYSSLAQERSKNA